jgi:hypothetical protein
MNLEVGKFWNWKWCQRCSFVGGFFSLLASMAVSLVSIDVLPHLQPEIRSRDLQVRFVCSIVASKEAVVSLAQGLFPVPGW